MEGNEGCDWRKNQGMSRGRVVTGGNRYMRRGTRGTISAIGE